MWSAAQMSITSDAFQLWSTHKMYATDTEMQNIYYDNHFHS